MESNDTTTLTVATAEHSGCSTAPICSAEMELADQLEMTALQHADQGEAEYAKPIMRAAFAIRKLVATLADANDACRSAHQVAERRGEQTNWRGIQSRLTKSLTLQFGVMYPTPLPGMNHFCKGESGSGEWSCRSETIPSLCGYCGEPNEALLNSLPGKMVTAPAVCNKCNSRYVSPTTGLVWSKCHCGGELIPLNESSYATADQKPTSAPDVTD